MLYFDDSGKLNYHHACESYYRYPLVNDEDECSLCEYTEKEIDKIRNHVEDMNFAYQKVYGKERR
jgi:hypothetical protein